MSAALAFVVAALATFYAADALSQRDGPFNVFADLRQLLLAKRLDGKGRFCHICMSAWTAAPFAALLCLVGYADPWLWPAVWLGLAGASVMLDRYWKRA